MNIHFDSIESTNGFCKKFPSLFSKKHLSFVSADVQTKGRGRFERVWRSEKGATLLLSSAFYLKPQNNLHLLPQILALSVCEVLKEIPLKIKWPNDLVLNLKKVGGILCEVISDQEEHFVILGIGLNLNQKAAFFSSLPEGTSLFLEGFAINRDVLKKELKTAFEKNLFRFLQEGFSPFYSLFNDFSAFSKGEMLYSKKEPIAGRYLGITSEGALILEMENGEIKHFFSQEFSSKKS